MDYKFEIVDDHIVRTNCKLDDGSVLFWDIYLENVFWGGRITFELPVDEAHFDKILWMYDLSDDEFAQTGEYRAKGPSTGVICLYTNRKYNKVYFIMFTNREQMYKRFVHFKHKSEKVRFTDDSLIISFKYLLQSDKGYFFRIRYLYLKVDKNNSILIDEDFYCSLDAKYTRCKINIPLESIVSKETDINNSIVVNVIFDDIAIEFHIGKACREKEEKYNFVPLASAYYKNKALSVRGNKNHNYSLVVRDMDDIEKDSFFQKMESPHNSMFMYYEGRLKRALRKRNINLFYEKNSMKAEEGTWEVFKAALELDTADNYYILDKNSVQWEELEKNPFVIQRYSKRYYELLYTANNCISTEMPSHLNVLRSNNKYVRRALMEKKFIFLQHGVTYMKRQGNTSAFIKGKDGEPDLIAVCSQKEAKIVSKMLKIPIDRCMITGLPIFSTIPYGVVNDNSDDIVTVMLTWKPYEEHLTDHFEDSSYYHNTMDIFELLKKVIPTDKIRVVAHPKVKELLEKTDIADSVWENSISEALSGTKLLITDYSSAAYNVFYQGGAIIFYQKDLVEYEKEVGELIPKDDEYIGERVYSIEELNDLLEDSIIEERILLNALRTKVFEERHKMINEFSDGKNIERIVDFLKQKGII